MLKIWNLIHDKMAVKRKSKVGKIEKVEKADISEIEEIYQEYLNRSIKEGIYYLKGSPYMKQMMKEYPDPTLLKQFFIHHFNVLDEREPKIPLEIGLFLEHLMSNPSTRLCIHRSDSIIREPLEDNILQSIMTEGLINNGAGLQGLVTDTVHLSQTVSSANDPISALSLLKSSFRGSTGCVLLALPKEYVDSQLEIRPPENQSKIYYKNEYGVSVIKPEFIIGYISTKNGQVKYYSREEILSHIQKKDL